MKTQSTKCLIHYSDTRQHILEPILWFTIHSSGTQHRILHQGLKCLLWHWHCSLVGKNKKQTHINQCKEAPKGTLNNAVQKIYYTLNEVLNHLWWRYYLSWNLRLNDFDSDQTNLRIPVSSALLPEWSLEWSPVPGPQSWFPVTTVRKSPKQLLEAHRDGTTVRRWNQSRRKKGGGGWGERRACKDCLLK